MVVTLGTRIKEWDFIVAEIGEDEGVLGNDFAMAQQLVVPVQQTRRIWGSAYHVPFGRSRRLGPSRNRLSPSGP